MTAEFDEEVVFENSPLYHYLQDLGHTDFEVCQPVPQEVEPCGAEEGPRTKDALGMPMLHILSSLVDTIRSWTPFSLDRQKDETLHKLDVGFRLDSLCTILRQEVLLQEDVELLELLDPGVLSAGQPEPPEARRHLPTLRSLATPNVWDLSVLFAFASSLFALKSWDVSSWLTWGPGLLAFAAFVFLRAVSKWRMAKLQMSLRKYHTQLENTVADSRAFTNLVRKALRLIQETEVISRGFTLVSAACPFDKAGQHPSQHLIGLRKAVYRSVRANFRLSRLATLYMLKHYPLNSEIDNVTNYICVVPLKDLRLGLSKVQVSEEEAHNLTDGFSLPALKVLFQLWIGQSSEFYRRLALLLSPENECIGPTTPLESLPHCIWSDVAMDLPHTQATCLAELKRSYEFYRYFETQHQSSSDRSTKTKQKMGELHNLHRAVRSLQLHLKALLNEVIILEDDVEKLASSKETPEPASEAYQVLEQKLKVINPHMQASNSCWEEASYQVEKMTRRRPEKKDNSAAPCENSHCTPVPVSTPALHIEDKDPIPEEQVFEAIVEETDLDDEYQREDFYCLSQEDRERQKREREESKRVLQELKSVLGLKASEAERLKWKQLLFSDHAAMTRLSPAETTEPTSNGAVRLSYDTETQDNDMNIDSHNKQIQDTNHEKSRTEYVSEETMTSRRVDICAQDGVLPEKEKTCYQFEGDEDTSKLGVVEVEASMPSRIDTVQSSVKDRLARLHLLTDFSFTSGLAAQVAARSIAFTFMDEQQTFGDEDEEEELEDFGAEQNGVLTEGSKSEQQSSDNGGTL
ncbi:vezatin isoform X2 [Ambystoma mexicanum]|uniref:vezatin isoform X2 n=1 Tax=Ambystoma mexicanum TaxID=8296 RepID=UPI0037E7E066